MFLKIIATVLEREGQWATPRADWVLANCWGSYLPCCFPWSTPGRSAGIWGFRCEWISIARRDSKVWEPSACYSNPREIRAKQTPLVENSQLLQTPEISPYLYRWLRLQARCINPWSPPTWASGLSGDFYLGVYAIGDITVSWGQGSRIFVFVL